MTTRWTASGRLVLAAAIVTGLGLVAVPFPALTVLAIGSFAVLVVVAFRDFRRGLRLEPPRLERLTAHRLVRGHDETIRYRLDGGGTAPCRITILDELPPALGADVIREVDWSGRPTGLVVTIRPRRRGRHPVGPAHLLWTSPSGFFHLRRLELEEDRVAVFPSTIGSRRRGVAGRRVLDRAGERPRRPRGEGSELESLREYVPGDDPRIVEWRATARRGRPIVRQLTIERNHLLLICIDTGRLMTSEIDGHTKTDHAIEAAVALVHAGLSFGDRVGLVAFDAELRAWMAPRRGAPALRGILEATLDLEARLAETSFRILAETLAARQKKRALVVILTDLVEGPASIELEQYLVPLRKRHVVLVVGLRDRILAEIDRPAPEIDADAIHRRLALQDVTVERHLALVRLERLGVPVLDLDPARATGPALARLLELRETSFG